MMKNKIIFSTTNYEYLKNAILDIQHIPDNYYYLDTGRIDRKPFPDGETYHKMEDVSGRDVVILGGTVSDSETLELYDMACHCAKDGANSLTLVIPYFGYATMERAVHSGEVVKAKTRARLLSSIPATNMKVLFMDLHSEGTPHYLEGTIRPVHLYAKKLIIQMCLELSGFKKDFVLASTDAGRAKWVESLANEMGVECAIITKRRASGTDTSIVGINADVKGKNVVIYDDMIRTGGSLINAGKAYKDAGAAKVFAVASHGVLPGDSIFKLYESNVFDKVYVTNTHPMSNNIKNGNVYTEHLKLIPRLKTFYKAFDVAPIIFDYLQNH